MKSQPIQPPETEWDFIQELQSPLWTCHHWKPRAPREDEAQLADGVFIVKGFPDSKAILNTTYEDLDDFLRAGSIPVKSTLDKSTFVIETRIDETESVESYRIEINGHTALLSAADSEGIRRAIFHLEEEMLRAGGPFLPFGMIARKPIIRTRISRCFFGPINRSPKNRDELADDNDYYPDQYLNRLAHHGVNGLWLTIKFCDLCPSRFFPEHGKDAARRLEKLRQTVAQCARYGIKIYAFCIEPRGFCDDSENLSSPTTLETFPQLAGHQNGCLTYFCTSSAEGQEYLESCAYHLFSNVPGLGGLIDINLGERPTHCYSSAESFFANNCPRCSRRSVASVFADTTGALQRGMHSANPNAEMVSWLYVPGHANLSKENISAIQQQMVEIAAAVPPKVLLQVNFESQGIASQWGRDHMVRDYSLAWVGPSPVFSDCAGAAVKAGARISAKLQVGNSHEVATVPFMPAPGILFRKYQKMRELGVSSAMQCWYFGNYPSPMTEAAGQLSFDPLPETEEEYLQKLAATHWGKNVAIMTEAWQHFTKAYEQFPAALMFSYYGPVHDSICWPLHLIPVDEPTQPSWLLKPIPSGDRVAESFAFEFSQDEIIETCRRMDTEWAKGAQLLEKIKPQYKDQREHYREIGVAQALALQFRSAWNVMRFYALRDRLPFAPRNQQLEELEIMCGIAHEEIANSEKLSLLAREDSRLGFHSEAEGYKYFPAKLAWRVERLQTLLSEDFPAVQRQVEAGKVLFPEFFGANPQGAIYHAQWHEDIQKPEWKVLLEEQCEHYSGGDSVPWEKYKTSWKAAADEKHLYLKISCQSPPHEAEQIAIRVEPRRCWPSQRFMVDVNGKKPYEKFSPLDIDCWDAKVRETADGWESELTILWKCFRESYVARRPIRINVSRMIPDVGTLSWRLHQPLPNRLFYGEENSADYGWVIFEERNDPDLT